MRKYFISFLVLTGFVYANLVNAIAIVVNNDPITLYDIDLRMQEKHFNKNDAIKSLIDELLYKQQIQKMNISVDIFDIDDYISKLAAQNNMSLLEFKSLIRQKQDYNQFANTIKQRLIHQKLIKKIARGNIKVATDDDIKIYYENNKQQFTIAQNIDVVAYVSKSKKALQAIQKNPKNIAKNVATQNISFHYLELAPKVRYIIDTTKIDQFSNIFAQNRNYNMFFIKNKSNIKVLPLAEVKERIFQAIMQQREKAYLNEYFETLRITADIKIYR